MHNGKEYEDITPADYLGIDFPIYDFDEDLESSIQNSVNEFAVEDIESLGDDSYLTVFEKRKKIPVKHPTLLRVMEMQPIEVDSTSEEDIKTISDKMGLYVEYLFSEEDYDFFNGLPTEEVFKNVACERILKYIDFLPNKRMRDFLRNLSDKEVTLFTYIVPVGERLKRKLVPNAKEIKRWNGYNEAFKERLR